MNIQFVIWGAGMRGERLALNLGTLVEAFIDTDSRKYSTVCVGKPIISLIDYQKKYRNCFIIVSPRNYSDIILILNKYHIANYFLMGELPVEMKQKVMGNHWYNIPIEFNINEHNAIYGCTAYSLLLYVYFKSKGCKKVSLIPHNQTNPLLLSYLENNCKEFDLTRIETVEDSVDKIFNTIRYHEISHNKKYIIDDMYDMSSKIVAYHNPSIQKFNGKHMGESCFIICNGPSLDMQDLECLRTNHIVSIALNEIFFAFDKTNWRPTYYIVADPDSIECDENEICEMKANAKFIADTYAPFWEKKRKSNIYKYHSHWEEWPNELIDEGPSFSEDFSVCAYNAATVTYEALQLAAYMGFKKIFLVGLDFDYSGGKDHFSAAIESRFEHIGLNNKDIISHRWNVLRNIVLNCYKKSKEYADFHGIHIYNATRGGKLEVFERVDFDTLFIKN